MDQFENREQENRQGAQSQNQPQDEPQVQYYADGKLTNDKEQLFTGTGTREHKGCKERRRRRRKKAGARCRAGARR